MLQLTACVTFEYLCAIRYSFVEYLYAARIYFAPEQILDIFQ